MKITTGFLFGFSLLASGLLPQARAQTAPPQAFRSMPAQGAVGYVDAIAGLAYTDNALLSSGPGKKSDGIAALGIATDYARAGMLSLDLLGNVERVQYLHNSYSGSFYGQFNGSAVLGKNTDPLQWRLSESFGEVMTDPLQAPTPQSLQTINDVATGPSLNLHFGLRNRLTLSAQYSRTTYQRSPIDSQSYEGGLKLSHALSGASYVALEGSVGRTEYLERAALEQLSGQNASDFDLWQGSLVFHADYVRTTVRLRAGYNELKFGGGAGRHGAPLYQLRVSRNISPFSTVFFDAEGKYSMNGAALASTNALVGLQTGATLNASLAVAQPYNERSGSVGWDFRRARTSFSVTATVRQTLYVQQLGPALDNNHLDEGVAVRLGRQLRPRTAVQLWARGYDDHYSGLHARTRRESFGLSFSKRFYRLAVSFYAERIHQSGTAGASNFVASSYNDDRVGVYATYNLFGARGRGAGLNGIPGMAGFMGGY